MPGFLRLLVRNMMKELILSAGLALCVTAPVHAASTFDGIFTDAQAQRGLEQYLQHCSVCHSVSLQGNNESPPLVGRFMPDWDASPLEDLYDYISTTMPLDHPGSLDVRAYTDIVAYLLKANGFPSGTAELQQSNLPAIRFDIRPPLAKGRGIASPR
jgi:S-disulfanyl-L-cysteine oxidoreductase SoxD